MPLSAEKINEAKDEARRYLEYTTFVLACILGVDTDELEHPYTAPGDGSSDDHSEHLSLAAQVEALSKIQQ